MGRSGYSDDWDGEGHPQLYWNAVKCAIQGVRGQKFLQQLAQEMDAMPVKRLIAEELVTSDGEVCAMGVIFKARGIDTKGVDPGCRKRVGSLLGIAPSMAGEIAYQNDDDFGEETCGKQDEAPEERWIRMRRWVAENLAAAQ